MTKDVFTRDGLRAAIIAAAAADPRVAGVLDYGSSGEGRGDAWSDLDMCLFIRDDHMQAFEAEWRPWAAGFGRLLLAYISGVGHPWAVYDTSPLPTRVDFAFQPESNADIILTMPNAPHSAEEMVPHDASGGRLRERAARLVGQDLGPADVGMAFEAVMGDLWYYLLRGHSKLMRGHVWAARQEYGWLVLGNLIGLLRLEAGALARWRNGLTAVGIEAALPAHRLAELEACVPGPGEAGLRAACIQAIALGRELCAALAPRYGREWPAELADSIERLYSA